VNRNILLIVVGPTAVGKTNLAIRLAKHYHTEIVSADARQIFRELNIGTAKPSDRELKEVKHHFVNSHSIRDSFNAGVFAREAEDTLNEIWREHRIGILCGGSGLYIKALLEGFDKMPDIPLEVRNQVIDDYETHGLEWLQNELAQADPTFYQTVEKSNPQRLMRGLEVLRTSGKPFSEFRLENRNVPTYHHVKIGLTLPRVELYERINQRVDNMINNGLFNEAKSLSAMKDLNALQTVGYSEIFGYQNGEYDQEEAIRLLKRNTRRYAKRQMTWFNADKEISWFHPDHFSEVVKFIEEKMESFSIGG